MSWANGYKAEGSIWPVHVAHRADGCLDAEPRHRIPARDRESYEIGVRACWPIETVRLNASAFDQKYTNFQLNTFTGIQFVVSSIRKLESKGAEFDVSWATPLSGLNLSGGVTYAFTNIEEFGDSAVLFAPDRLNDRLSFAPLWSGVASASYTVPLSASLQFRGSVTEKYNSSYNTGSDLDPRKLQGAYGLLNARLGLGSVDGKWTVEAWGANLTNKGIYQVAFDAPFQYHRSMRSWAIRALRNHASSQVLARSIVGADGIPTAGL